jgi:hypothetical protein
MVRDLVTEQEQRSVPVPVPAAPPVRYQVQRPSRRKRAEVPSKRLKSMYRRANVHISLRAWAQQLRGPDGEVAAAWFRNKLKS